MSECKASVHPLIVCDLDAGHDGPHLYETDKGLISWEQDPT